MKNNLEAVKQQAKDLRKDSPRDPEVELGGYTSAARALDKCRATLSGMQGEYMYGCPMDRRFLDAAGIGVEEFKQFVATGATDEEVAEFLQQRAPASR